MTSRLLSRVVLYTCDNCQRTTQGDSFPESWGAISFIVLNNVSVPRNGDSHVCAECLTVLRAALIDAARRGGTS